MHVVSNQSLCLSSMIKPCRSLVLVFWSSLGQVVLAFHQHGVRLRRQTQPNSLPLFESQRHVRYWRGNLLQPRALLALQLHSTHCFWPPPRQSHFTSPSMAAQTHRQICSPHRRLDESWTFHWPDTPSHGHQSGFRSREEVALQHQSVLPHSYRANFPEWCCSLLHRGPNFKNQSSLDYCRQHLSTVRTLPYTRRWAHHYPFLQQLNGSLSLWRYVIDGIAQLDSPVDRIPILQHQWEYEAAILLRLPLQQLQDAATQLVFFTVGLTGRLR